MRLDDALTRASTEIHETVAGIDPGPVPGGSRRHRPGVRGGLLVALVVAVGGAVFVGLRWTGDSPAERVTVAADAQLSEDGSAGLAPFSEQMNSAVTEEEIPRYVADVVPDGLTRSYSGPVADLGPATGTEHRWVYGHANRRPLDGERPVIVVVLDGQPAPAGLLDGEDVDVNGVDGRILEDGSVMFLLGDVAVWVHGGAGADLLAVAGSVVADDGVVKVPETTPGGYELLGGFDTAFYEETDGAVPVDGHVTVYRQGYTRYLNVLTQPRSPELTRMYEWMTPPNAETVSAGGQTYTYLHFHSDFGAPASLAVWMDDEVVGRVTTYGIERDAVDAALSSLRPDGEGPSAAAVVEPSEQGEVAAPASADDLDDWVPTAVLDDMVILNAVEHARLGVADWSAEQYLFGPSGASQPSPADPVLLLTVASGSDGLLHGDPITIGGHRGVVVDKDVAGASADIELIVGDSTVQLTARANLGLDEVIAAAEQYALWVAGGGGFELGAPSIIGVDLYLRESEAIAAWFDEDVNGPTDGSTVVYGEIGTRSDDGAPRINVTITSGSSRSLDWLRWMFPSATTSVRVGDTDGVLAAPTADVRMLRFEHGNRVVQITGTSVDEADLLAAAAPFADG